jgi:hypothetical protein
MGSAPRVGPTLATTTWQEETLLNASGSTGAAEASGDPPAARGSLSARPHQSDGMRRLNLMPSRNDGTPKIFALPLRGQTCCRTSLASLAIRPGWAWWDAAAEGQSDVLAVRTTRGSQAGMYWVLEAAMFQGIRLVRRPDATFSNWLCDKAWMGAHCYMFRSERMCQRSRQLRQFGPGIVEWWMRRSLRIAVSF